MPMASEIAGAGQHLNVRKRCAAQKLSEALQFATLGIVVSEFRQHQPINIRDADRRGSILSLPVCSKICVRHPGLQAMWAQPDRECPVPRTDEDVRYCNGSPILEACASDEIHSAVSHNPNALDGCFR